MSYGNFSEDGKEFIIEKIDTPSPWINYLYNEEYFTTISNNGGGISYINNPLHGRITRYRINDVPSDRPGKYIYVKDAETNEVWSLTWQPVGNNKEAYKAIHGFGYTKVLANINQIKSEVTFYVPENENQENWICKLKNNSSKKRKLLLTGYVEFALGHALVDVINQCDDQHFNRIYFDKDANSLFATKTYWVTENSGTQQQENKEWNQWAFFTVNTPIKNYETNREKFIGFYRNENNPLAIETDNFSNRDIDFGNTVGAIQTEIELLPNEELTLIFSLGVIQKENFNEEKSSRIEKYHNIEVAEKELSKVQKRWEEYLTSVLIDTPDDEVNTFINYWTKYQAKVAFDVGRVASFYYWGISRGFGFRDTAQDTIAIMLTEHDRAKERIELLSKHIFTDGKAYHHFYKEGQGELTQHCDDPLWYILCVCDYIKETGNSEILNQVENFADGKTGTILEHLLAVASFAKSRLGKHNLPIFGRGDWNDTLDYIGGEDGGESVWGGMFYVKMLNDLIELLKNTNNEKYISEVKATRDLISESLDKYCWDGSWFIRAFGEDNSKIGSSANEYGKIFLNTQSWAVIADVSAKERLITAMDSVKSHLDTKYGPKICAPAYKEINKNIGLVTRCVAGKKENGAIFCHPTTWLIQAECLLGRGEIAFDYYKKLLPSKINHEIFTAEPYVYSQYITSDEHPSEGKASHSWQTGTAAWMYRIFIDYIIGIRASYNGLFVSPAIPKVWKEYSYKRIFRGTTYNIKIKNQQNKENGKIKLRVDEKDIEGNIIPLTDEKECNVIVEIY